MPYIKPNDRVPYDEPLKDLLDKLSEQDEEDLGGHLNYCVTYLINNLWRNKQRYVRVNTIRGAMENLISEWYLVHVFPYEKEKRRENGGV